MKHLKTCLDVSTIAMTWKASGKVGMHPLTNGLSGLRFFIDWFCNARIFHSYTRCLKLTSVIIVDTYISHLVVLKESFSMFGLYSHLSQYGMIWSGKIYFLNGYFVHLYLFLLPVLVS